MKRVMILTNSLTGGGAERSMNLVCNELSRRGWPVSLVPVNTSEPDLVIPVCEVFPLSRKWQSGIVAAFSTFLKLNRIVRSWRPDVIILNCDLPELFGALLPGKRKLVVIEHSNPAWTTRMHFGKVIRRILLMRAATWVAVSSHLQIWPYGIAPNAVLQNPLAPSKEVLHNVTISSHAKRLIYIGRLASTQKRPEWVLEIGALTDLEVLIIGDGLMKQTLQDRAALIHPKSEFTGYVRDPWALIKPEDLLIVPSAWEGDGLVVIEGMKRRIPMLLSDIPDFRRFNLPSCNYCRDVEDFVTRTNHYRDNLNSLVVPSQIRDSILRSRSLHTVGDTWERFLVSI